MISRHLCILSSEAREPMKFQSRNRGSFDFKWKSAYCVQKWESRFNLVIEVLLISSPFTLTGEVRTDKFQSRNRGSFDFKSVRTYRTSRLHHGCFNLVIEVLLISSLESGTAVANFGMFQSRNRGSFDFKLSQEARHSQLFRLLFQSRNRGSFDFKVESNRFQVKSDICFNLVIEVLLISSIKHPFGGCLIHQVSIS